MQFYVSKRRPPSINIVTLIDILCILLIFFIVTTTFKKVEPEIEINLPESSSGEAQTQKSNPIVIYLTEANEIYLADQKITIEQLKDRLLHIKETVHNPVFGLKGDTKTDYGLVIRVMDAAKEAGIENLSAFTQDSTPTPAP